MDRSTVLGEGEIAYRRVASDLRQQISDGKHPPDRRLPTEAELSVQYRVGRQTVRRAMQDLVAEGLVYRVRGRGTFAAPGSRDARYLQSVGTIDDLLALALDTTLETIRPFARSANVEVASRLQLPSDVVAAGLFRRLHEGTPYCVLQVYLPPELAGRVVARDELPEPGEPRAITVISVLEDVVPDLIAVAQQSISVTTVPSEVAPLIDLESGDSALRIDRIYLAFNGDPVLLAVSYFHPERYTYRLSLRRSSPPR